MCNSQENGVCTRCAAIVNHRAMVKILRVVNLLRVVFLVRRGPLGMLEPDFWEGYATKHFSVKKGLFSEKGGRQFSE